MKRMETDVVIIGYGAAGGVAAITAHDAGAKVVILEKAPFIGGNTICAGGNIMIGSDERFSEYLKTLSCGLTDDETVETLAKGSIGIPDWVRSMGGDCYVMVPRPPFEAGAGYKHIPNSEYMDKWNIEGDRSICSAQHLMELLKTNVEQRGIPYHLNTPVTELIQGEDGAICGVRAVQDGEELEVRVRKAVIMTCGGYEANEEMKRDYFSFHPVTTLGTPYNTGDGVKMVQRVGADLWHMNSTCSGVPAYKHPDYEASFPIQFRTSAVIYVDQKGRRFFDEKKGVENHGYGAPMSHFDHQTMTFDRCPMYAIFDDQDMKKPLFPPFAGYNKFLYTWSTDNRTELEKGWIKRHETLEDLATDLGMDPDEVKKSVEGFNACARAGQADEFGRQPETMLEIHGGPYYTIPLWLGLFSTMGGPRRDKDSRVLDLDRKPIPRLYAAGEFGSVIGQVYQGGSSIAECIVFGRIAGENAAREVSM